MARWIGLVFGLAVVPFIAWLSGVDLTHRGDTLGQIGMWSLGLGFAGYLIGSGY